MDQATRENMPNLLQKLPMRLHHYAYTTDDHEQNRQFYEEVLGLPLVAMYVEREFLEGDWVELRRAYVEVCETEGRIRYVLPYVLKSANLGEPAPCVNLEDILKQDYSRPLCRPLVKR